MGFLSRLFHRPLSRERWYIRVDLLTELSEIARKHWAREWTAEPTDSAGFSPEGPAPALPADAEMVFRIFQAHLTLAFIRQHGYVPAADQSDFAAYLLGHLAGEQTPEAAALLDRYSETERDRELLLDRFAADLDTAMRNGGISAQPERIRATLPQLALEQHYVTALSFSDRETARVLKAQIEAAGDDPAGR